MIIVGLWLIINLVNFIKEHYWTRGFHEVIAPNMFNLDLWVQSGHAQHYKDDMFCFEVEGKEWAMKPMNCPGHCLIFGQTIRHGITNLTLTRNCLLVSWH